jgi:ArsR family transcriptional regulator, arsenate/arsenite/antimonite-responsive transcriptional repressor
MKAKQAIEALSALAHEHRLGVYRLLVEAGPEGVNAGTIAARLKLPPSSLTFHLQHLHRAGLITQQRNSRQLIYAADFAVMNGLVGYLTENCCVGSSCDTECAPVRDAGKTSKKSAKVA